MPGTGITVSDDAIGEYNNMKMTNTPGKQRLVMYIVDNTEVQVSNDDSADTCNNDDLVTFLSSEHMLSRAAYVLHDFERAPNDKRVICILWTPSTTHPPGNKMIYASTFETVKMSFNGIWKNIELAPDNAGDVTIEEITEKF